MDGFLSNKQVTGHRISLERSDPRHIEGSRSRRAGAGVPGDGSFGRVMMDGLEKVNNLQQESLQLSRQMITDPESVDAHDVTIALAEANMALNITKAVVDRVIRAYKDITGGR